MMAARARRRLAWLAGLVGVLAVAVVIHHATDSSKHASKPQQQQSAIGSMNLGVIDGASRQQVLQHIGQPTGKRGRCWIYRTSVGTFNGIYVGKYIDAVRFCFIGGTLSDIEDHWNIHDAQGPRWMVPVVISTHPSPP